MTSRHAEIGETLHWLNPAVSRTVQAADRFTTVYDRGIPSWLIPKYGRD